MRKLQLISQVWNSLVGLLGIAVICACIYFSVNSRDAPLLPIYDLKY
jgi:hypothetical protein